MRIKDLRGGVLGCVGGVSVFCEMHDGQYILMLAIVRLITLDLFCFFAVIQVSY